jgi:hypothetical protein
MGMSGPEWILVCLSAAVGTSALMMVAAAFRHGVVRNRHYFGPVFHRDDEPFDYYYNLAHWVIYLVSCYGFVGIQLHWACVARF